MTAHNSNIAISYWALKDDMVQVEANSELLQLKTIVNNLIQQIKESLFASEGRVKEEMCELLDDVFYLRIASIKFLELNSNNLDSFQNQLLTKFEDREVPNYYEWLNESVQFAIRTTNRISNSLVSNPSSKDMFSSFELMSRNEPDELFNSSSSYKSFLRSVGIINKQFPNDIFGNLIKLINSSLYTEIGIISSDILFDDTSINVSAKFLEELNEIIVEEAQEYGAIAREIGIVIDNYSSKLSKQETIGIDADEIRISEMGLDEFLSSIVNE